MSILINEVQTVIHEILLDMVQDWDVDVEEEYNGSTRLVQDLAFASVDIIHLVVAIEEQFHRPKLGFDELLMTDGRYRDDLSLDELCQFVNRKLNGV